MPHELDDAETPARLAGARLDAVLLRGFDLSDARAGSLRLRESRLDAVVFDRAQLEGASFADVVAEAGSWANARAQRAELRRVEARGVRATGLDATESELEDVVFDDVRLDLASFRFATLLRVVFRDCRLDEADFYGARLESVLFERTSLVRASVDGASLERVELRGCELGGLQGAGHLRGARMPWQDIVQNAGVLAAAAGVHIIE